MNIVPYRPTSQYTQ